MACRRPVAEREVAHHTTEMVASKVAFQLPYLTLYVRSSIRVSSRNSPRPDTYLIVMTLLGSVILYGRRNLAYIDALFFASGAATQSGLNTYVGTAALGKHSLT